MKKIATITTHTALNYGAVLQAYALCKYIQMTGNECSILDYQPSYVKKSYQIITKPRKLQDIFLCVFQIVHYSSRKNRKKKFEEFRKSYLTLSKETISGKERLIEYANAMDLLICGSDQIWNPTLHEFDEAYFFSYEGIDTPKISYAASFGQDCIEEKYKTELIKRLKGFRAFGCREHSAQLLLNSLVNRESKLVLDPVFLLEREHWDKIAIPVFEKKKYDLVYFLSNPGRTVHAVKNYSSQKNRQVISIGFSPRDMKSHGVIKKYDLGPREFLGYIISAETIITNSFHCTAFSIIFRKNFFVRIVNTGNSRNDRMLTLLRELGLEERVFTDQEADLVDYAMPINYDDVEKRLMQLSEQSKNFLMHELSIG